MSTTLIDALFGFVAHFWPGRTLTFVDYIAGAQLVDG